MGKTVQGWEMKIRPVHPVDSSQWVNEEGRGKSDRLTNPNVEDEQVHPSVCLIHLIT